MAYLKNTITIINPSAGMEFPILARLNTAVKKHHITNTVLVTQYSRDAKKFAEQAKKAKPDAVIVYGGDGTITEVAAVLYTTDIPLIIIPGGTANVLAKELDIPTDPDKALKILGRKPNITEVDVALCEKKPLFLRVEVGILADMVKEVSSDTKTKFGILAYPIAALQKALAAVPAHYSLTLDGKKKKLNGVGLMIANVGNIGIPGFSMHSTVSCSDGKLDVFVLESNELSSLVAVSSSTLAGTTKPSTLKHWRAREIKVTVEPQQTIICDDRLMKKKTFSINMGEAKLKVLT